MKKNTVKAKPTKVTKEELKNIQDTVSNINRLQIRVGDLEIQKHAAVALVLEAQKELGTVQNSLRDKYGDVIVNINDGSLKPKEDEVNTKN